MKISSKTKISAILRHNMDAVEVIASINPHFRKLRNPVLRKLLAPRVTVADAASIGKCSVDLMLEKLQAIGFEIEQDASLPAAGAAPEQDASIEAAIRSGKVHTLDVRPVLEQGVDPFEIILARLKTIPDGHVLELINTFEPVPLLKILQKKGYSSQVRHNGDVVHTFFLKTGEPAQSGKPHAEWLFQVSSEVLEEKHLQFGDHSQEVDVRDMEMPLPMLTILSALERLPDGYALFVHHKKTPQYLLPELADRHLRVWMSDIAEGNVKMLIHR